MSADEKYLYEFEPFVLDARNGILLNGDSTVRLTPKAFQTLLVLVRHASEVVDKDQLMAEVWPGIFVEEGNLSRNIYEIRKALGDDTAEPRYVETIPKRGYRFIAPTKVSLVNAAPTVAAAIEASPTVIEKHTFARISESEAETDSTEDVALTTPVVDVRPVMLPTAARRKRATYLVAAVAVAVLIIVATALFLFSKRVHVPPQRGSRAKSTLVRLTNNNAQDSSPSWSADGRRIAFASNRDGKTEIYIMDADGSNVSRLTNNSTDDDFPRWSPDGRRILFHSNRDGNGETYVMNADGANQTRLTIDTADDRGASWSPDGKRIAFASNRGNTNPYNFDIFVMDADGSNVRK